MGLQLVGLEGERMKIRNGFVSNSSSSSFVCDVCKETVSGYDMTLYDAAMFQCVNGHTICEEHAPETKKGIDGDARYEFPAGSCPCCNFIEISDRDLINYLLANTHSTRTSITKACRDRFRNYEEFNNYINNKVLGRKLDD